ncbi:MAG TPA: PVC-type heme-binding CxxCH protein, partial [Pirellulales bacterium]|nr:PVC-type heme-binding CxxCH protein [Pirellulales bacterium]
MLPLLSELAIAAEIELPRVADERLRIELFAAEPQIVTPIGVAVDAAGRVLVVENHTHERTGDYQGPPADRIRILEDTDHDGRADRMSTFYEGPVALMSLAIHPNGWLYAATRNEIFRLRDKDADGASDERETLVAMESAEKFPHNGLSGVTLDFQGNVYFILGENRGAEYQLTAADQTKITGTDGAGCVFRCEQDGGRLQCVAKGFWNPFSMALDTFGRLFAADNDPGNRPPCRLLRIVEGGQYGYRRRALEPFIAWNGELPGTLPMLASTGEAPTGLLAYESDGLPPEYRGNLLVACWGENRIDRYQLEPQGASLEAKARPLVTGERYFRPTGMALAPDGSVYFGDWADRSYPVHGKGRIWRLSWREAPRPERPSDPRLGLVSAHRPLREASARQLAKDKAGATFLIDSLRHEDSRVRSTALAALIAQQALTAEAAQTALADGEPAIREQAARTLPRPLCDDARVARSDDDPAVRAAAMRRLSDPRMAPLLLEALDNGDPYFRQAAREGMWHSLDLDALRKLARHDNPAVRLAALLILGERPEPLDEAIVADALADDDRAIRFVAVQWIGERQIERLRAPLIEELRTRATTPELFDASLAALAELDGVMSQWNFGKSGDWWKKASGSYNQAARLLADPQAGPVVRKWALRLLPPGHSTVTVKLLRELIATDDLPLRAEAVRALRELGKSAPPERVALLLSLAEDAAQPTSIRAEAVIGTDASTPAGCQSLVRLALASPPAVRDEALRTLRTAALDDEQRTQLGGLSALGTATADLVARVLWPAVAAAKVPPLPLEDWLQRLRGPADPAAGERIFFHPKGPGCYQCHRIEGRGRSVGPEFTRTAGRLGISHARLVESILFPSKEVAPGYVPWTIVLDDGRALTGIFHR